jgi:uncharacterized delta-60 repeat protein
MLSYRSLVLKIVIIIVAAFTGAINSFAFNASSASGTNGTVSSLALQLDGKVLIGGDFSQVRGVQYFNIARLNSNGTLDRSFDSGDGPDSTVLAIVLQPDGKVLIGGAFAQVNSAPHAVLARLNADGTVDGGFNFDSSPNDSSFVSHVVLQPDGKILIALSPVNPVRFGRTVRVIRLNSDGSVDGAFDDETFDPIFDSSFGVSIRALALQVDGKVIIGGSFTLELEGNITRRNIIRLNPDGSIDSTFNVAPDEVTQESESISIGPSRRVESIALQPNGQILMGGSFSFLNPLSVGSDTLLRLNTDGSLDQSFLADYNNGGLSTNILVQPNGRILTVVGVVVTVPSEEGRTTRQYLARVNSNGTLDRSFEVPRGALGVKSDGIISALALQPDGKVIIGGSFQRGSDGSQFNAIARLNPDGSLDTPADLCFPVKNASGTVSVICL